MSLYTRCSLVTCNFRRQKFVTARIAYSKWDGVQLQPSHEQCDANFLPEKVLNLASSIIKAIFQVRSLFVLATEVSLGTHKRNRLN